MNLFKAFMHRSKLKIRYHKFPTEANKNSYKKFRNFCVNLLKKEKRTYYSNLDLKVIEDNKKFWQNVKPLFSGKSKSQTNITIVDNEKVVTVKGEIAEILNNCFIEAVQNLEIKKFTCEDEQETQFGKKDEIIENILEKYQSYPSIFENKGKYCSR